MYWKIGKIGLYLFVNPFEWRFRLFDDQWYLGPIMIEWPSQK